MRYIAKLYQPGGCDYTIGCGYMIHEFEADNIEHATEVLKKWMDEAYGSQYDEIDEVTLFEVSIKKEIPFDKWKQDRINFIQNELNLEKERKEKESYERLKRKFG